MPADDFHTPTDIDALRMENELLSFEVRFLRARFADPLKAMEEVKQAAERSVAEAKSSEADLRERLEKAQRNRETLQKRLEKAEELVPESEERRAELKRAEKDLISLLKSMSESPRAVLLRRGKDFRDLEERYLRDG